MMTCCLCGEPIMSGDDLAPVRMVAHRECMVRAVVGSIGHTYRQSAREVAARIAAADYYP